MALPVRPDRRRRALVVVMLMGAGILVLASIGDDGWRRIVRDWAPGLYLLVGYWVPSLMVVALDERLERWLIDVDRRWFGTALSAFERAPRLIGEALEIAYLFCYPLIPSALGCLYVAGFTAEADRFWTAVLVAGFGSYGPLPWWPTRPPRAIERARPRFTVQSMNLHVLSRASVQWNTFPSGHVATSLAAALAVASVLPSAGLVVAVIALAIAVASVVGRYHYAADALAGALLAAIGFGVSRLV
jgi:membrane-associated phospholipid phosphatase